MADPIEETITDPKERIVIDALADPRWDFRTTEGIAKNTGIDEAEVKAILEKSNLIRKSPVPDERGRELYTLRTRPVSTRENLAVAQRALTKSAF